MHSEPKREGLNANVLVCLHMNKVQDVTNSNTTFNIIYIMRTWMIMT